MNADKKSAFTLAAAQSAGVRKISVHLRPNFKNGAPAKTSWLGV
jgi:hypothetical protein